LIRAKRLQRIIELTLLEVNAGEPERGLVAHRLNDRSNFIVARLRASTIGIAIGATDQVSSAVMRRAQRGASGSPPSFQKVSR